MKMRFAKTCSASDSLRRENRRCRLWTVQRPTLLLRGPQ
jgi:hypothetical protein